MIKITNSIKLFIVLFVGAFLLLGCTQEPDQTPPEDTSSAASSQAPSTQPPATTSPAAVPEPEAEPVEPEPVVAEPEAEPVEPEPANIAMNQIYQYGSVTSYTYRLSSSGAPDMDMTTTISSDIVGGTAAWLQEIDMSTEEVSIVSSTWLDKATLNCLKMSSSMDIGGQVMETDIPCPATGSSASGSGTEAPELEYVGTESVTVPAGTFNANKYVSGTTTMWSASDVPVPLKTSSDGGNVVMELVEYS
ncbi:MAG: hypothetical protein ABIH83_02995 [Candidatus Micrarchaeota archaeon]